MKYIIKIYLFLIVMFSSCSVKHTLIDVANKDIIVFDLADSNLKLAFMPATKVQNTFIATLAQSSDFVPLIETNFFLVKDKDTMRIQCFCAQGENYYFKKIKFRKGVFSVNFKKSNIKTSIGSIASNSKYIKNIIFNYSQNNVLEKKKTLFKNIQFRVINLSDTTNVKFEHNDKKSINLN